MDFKDNQLRSPTFWERQRKRILINWKLAPLKIVMFLMYGGMASLHPYMTPHMKSIGFTGKETSIVLGFLPIVSFIGPPIGGLFADKTGNYKAVLLAFNLICTSCHIAMGFFIPSAYVVVKFNVTNLSANISCLAPDQATLTPDFILMNQCQIYRGARWPNAAQKFTFSNCSTYPSNCVDATKLNGKLINLPQLHPTGFTWKIKKLFAQSNETSFSAQCWTNKTVECSIFCNVSTNFSTACRYFLPAPKRYLTVGLYTSLRLLSGMMIATIFPLLDAAAYQMSEDYFGDLGFQRVFTLLGMCMFPPLSSYLTELTSKSNWYDNDYSPSFYIFSGMHLLASVMIIFMQINVKNTAENILKNVGKILINPQVLVFVLIMGLAGAFWGFLENFLFIFMEDELGSEKWLLGFSNLVSGVAAIPVVAASTLIMKYFGHTKLIILCVAIYGVRFLSYAYIYNPFHILPVEILEAFTTSLLWVVASVYCAKIAPKYLATLQGVIGSMHHGIGRGAGSFAGGMMFEKLKPRLTYKIFAGISFSSGLIYAILHYSWLREVKNPQKAIEETEGPVEARRESHLSSADEQYLRKTARMNALGGRRYSLAVMMSNRDRTFDSLEEPETSDQHNRRRSTLRPTLFGI